MRCFNLRSVRDHASPAAAAEGAASGTEAEGRDRHRSPRSGGSSAQASPTINLATLEYTQALQSHSYNEIWAKIHPDGVEGWEATESEVVDGNGTLLSPSTSPAHHLTAAGVLQPNRDSIQEALSRAPPGKLTRLVSDYFDGSEHTTRLCLLLHRSVRRARAIYAPLYDLVDLLPPTNGLSPAQCEWAFNAFLEFDRVDNPFPAPQSSGDGDGDGGSGSFGDMRRCFCQLKDQVDMRLRRARRRARLLGDATRCSAVCLVGTAVGVVVSGLVIASHALAVLVACGPPILVSLRPGDLLAGGGGGWRRRLLEHVGELEAAARGAYVLNNDLDTIERLVARLHASVESDKALVRLGLERGRGDRHPIEEVVRQLRRNHPSFLHQLADLEEHVCLCFAAINRARSLLFQQIQHNYRRRHAATSGEEVRCCHHSCLYE